MEYFLYTFIFINNQYALYMCLRTISIILAYYRHLQKLGKLELGICFIYYSHISKYDAVYN